MAKKERLVDPKARIAICVECPWFVATGYKYMEKCLKCGCFARAKVQMKSFTCPDKRW